MKTIEELAEIHQEILRHRIAPNPTPADKLSDEQLGEIGAKAALSVQFSRETDICIDPAHASVYQLDAAARTAFASAVREAVEKEQQQGIGFLSSDKRGDWPEDFAHENGNYCVPCCECGKKFMGHKRRVACKICVGIKGSIKQAEEIARLTAEVARYSGNCKVMDIIVGEQQAEIAKANVELERLCWRSSAVNPECGDYPIVQDNGSQKMVVESGSSLCLINAIRWVPLPKSPAPTAEEKEREGFEVWAKHRGLDCHIGNEPDRYASTQTDWAWGSWQARAKQEAQP